MVPTNALVVTGDGRHAILTMRDLAVIDQPRWPAHNAETLAVRISFRAEWTATDERVVYDDPAKLFRVTGWLATARLEAEVEVPALGFTWRSDPLESSSTSFGVIGEEVNGRYYSP